MRIFLAFIGLGILSPSVLAGTPTLYVHPQRGNDTTGNGSAQKPFRTLTHALEIAPEGTPTTIAVQAGVYSQATGESFPLRLKPGVILRGNEAQYGQGVIISGGGRFRSPRLFDQNATIVANNQTEIRGVTISNPNLRGYGVWIENTNPTIAYNTLTQNRQDGALITGNASPALIANRFVSNGSSNVSVEGDARPLIQQNVLQQAIFGITIRHQASPRLVSNAISTNQNGVMVQTASRPILRGNVIEKNSQNGVIVLGEALPDLGTLQDGGKNTFRANGMRDIYNGGNQSFSAVGNQFDQARVFGKVALDVPVVVSTNLSLSNTSTAFSTEPIPNSVVVRISGTSPRSVGINSAIDPNLPPVTIQPPADGLIVSNPIPVTPVRPTLPLKFRVVVPIYSEDHRESVRRLVPGAFPLSRSGQNYLQVGAFNSAQLANEQVQKLVPLGLNALVEQF